MHNIHKDEVILEDQWFACNLCEQKFNIKENMNTHLIQVQKVNSKII